jgi:hypothetical protein
LSYVRMASIAVEEWRRKKTKPRETAPAGVLGVGRAQRPSDETSKSTQVASVALFT